VPRTGTLELQLTAHRRQAWVCTAGLIGFAVLTAIGAQIRVPLPFSPVPVTLQTLVVLLAGVTLGRRAAAASMALYVTAGACGLPIFSGWSAFLTGATAGYLLAFPLAAWIAGAMSERKSVASTAAGLGLATLAIWICGAAWLTLMIEQPITTVLMAAVVPFIAGDLMKAAAVLSVARMARGSYERAADGQHRD